jgi:hypothetical protein
MTVRPYTGWERWRYRLCAHPDQEKTGVVHVTIPTGNYREDEGFARYLVRKQLGLRRLPAGARVWPDYPPS